jgi:hypothetical protein
MKDCEHDNRNGCEIFQHPRSPTQRWWRYLCTDCGAQTLGWYAEDYEEELLEWTDPARIDPEVLEFVTFSAAEMRALRAVHQLGNHSLPRRDLLRKHLVYEGCTPERVATVTKIMDWKPERAPLFIPSITAEMKMYLVKWEDNDVQLVVAKSPSDLFDQLDEQCSPTGAWYREYERGRVAFHVTIESKVEDDEEIDSLTLTDVADDEGTWDWTNWAKAALAEFPRNWQTFDEKDVLIHISPHFE